MNTDPDKEVLTVSGRELTLPAKRGGTWCLGAGSHQYKWATEEERDAWQELFAELLSGKKE